MLRQDPCPCASCSRPVSPPPPGSSATPPGGAVCASRSCRTARCPGSFPTGTRICTPVRPSPTPWRPRWASRRSKPPRTGWPGFPPRSSGARSVPYPSARRTRCAGRSSPSRRTTRASPRWSTPTARGCPARTRSIRTRWSWSATSPSSTRSTGCTCSTGRSSPAAGTPRRDGSIRPLCPPRRGPSARSCSPPPGIPCPPRSSSTSEPPTPGSGRWWRPTPPGRAAVTTPTRSAPWTSSSGPPGRAQVTERDAAFVRG